MDDRCIAAGLLALLAATANCATKTGDDPGPAQPDDEAPLELSVDRVDVMHGALRVSATMDDGSADLSVWLGGGCDPREVGGGIATRSKFVWMFAADELADAMRCGLLVRANSKTVAGHLTKVASVPVDAAVTPLDSDDAPQWSEMPLEDIALAVLAQRPLRLGGASFEATLSVNGTPLKVD